MAYGKKYNYYFYWDHNSSNNYYEVAFYVDGYASTVTELTPTDLPFSINTKGQKDATDQVVIGSEAIAEILVNKASLSTFDTDFLEIDYKDVIVKLIQDPTGTPITKWAGLLLPQNADREYQGFKYNYSLSASDGLAQLKELYYTSDGKETGGAYSGFEDMLTIIKTAISKVADTTELQLDFRIQLGTYSDQMTSTENALKENEIPQELFYDNEGNPDTCYDVIAKILTPFYCSIVQADGYFWIFNNSELNSYYFEYDWSTLTQQSRTAHNRYYELYGSTNNSKLFNRGVISKVQGYGFLDLILQNREYQAQILPNTEFESNITGWSNGNASAGTNGFTVLSHSTDSGFGGVLDATYGGSATAGTYNFSTTSTFNLVDVGSGAINVEVTYAVKRNTETPSGLTAPKVKMRLYNATDGYLDSVEGQRTLSVLGNYYIFTDSFLASSLTVTANKLNVEIEITDATTTGSEFYFDYIRMEQLSGTTAFGDWLIKSELALTKIYPSKKEIDIYIADSRDSTSEMFSIKDAGGNYTSTWARYGVTEARSLTQTFNISWFNDNYKAMDFVRCSMYDNNEDINLFNILYDNTASRVRYYRIISIDKNYRDAIVNLQLKEIGISGADKTVYTSAFKQTT